MNKTLTLDSCITKADELGIKIYGDVKNRQKSNKEDSDLISFFAWVRYQYPHYESLIFHPETEMVVNGGNSYAYHARSKAKGRVNGIADIVCLPISKNAPAFICELKRANIAQSLASKKLKEHYIVQILRLSSQKEFGNIAIVALGFESAKCAFEEYVNKYGE